MGGFVSPFVGFNAFTNPTDNDALNLEGTAAANFGLGGRQDVAGASGIPHSGTITVGFGWQHMFEDSDYGLGIELFGSAEGASNITSGAGKGYDWAGGLRFGWGAINPRRAVGDN